MVGVRVERFTGEASEWDAFVRKQGGWTHFHFAGWRTVIEEVFGHEVLHLVGRAEDGQLVGVLPLVRVKSKLFGHYLVSMPFVNYGGPLGSPEAVGLLTEHAVRLACESGAELLELRSRVPLDVGLPATHRKVTVLLDLPADDAEPLWNRLTAKVRSQVRRPQKEGVDVRFGLEQLEPFYEVFARHMRDLGTPVQPRAFFEHLARVFPTDVHFGCAYLHGRPVACGCGFSWGREFEMTWASALFAYKSVAANMLLYWSFMEKAIEEGISVFNFGRCTPGGGTHRFKLQWGGRDAPLYWYQHTNGRRDATPSPDSGPFSWGPAVWKRLPLAIANALGPRIVRNLP